MTLGLNSCGVQSVMRASTAWRILPQEFSPATSKALFQQLRPELVLKTNLVAKTLDGEPVKSEAHPLKSADLMNSWKA